MPMILKPRKYLILLLIVNIPSRSFSDAAPPSYPGFSLALKDTGCVRLKSETVDIYYGDRCKVEAVFNVQNTGKSSLKKKIGFPFHIRTSKPWLFPTQGDTTIRIYDFTMNLNGERLTETDILTETEFRSDKKYWYGWTCPLKTGMNRMTLTYHIVPGHRNPVHWEKVLYYAFRTDDKWPDTIDNLEITVHFPEPVDRRQILSGTIPPGYEISEKKVHWRFTPFSPKPGDQMALYLIDFTIFKDMLKYEKVLSLPGTDNATKLTAAKFFANLAPFKGFYLYPPNSFDQSYYESSVIPALKPSERPLFDQTYKFHKGFQGRAFYSVEDYSAFEKNDSLRYIVMQVMARISYYEKIVYPVTYNYLVGAKRLFREIVTSEPKNAAAWRAYLDNYYKIESNAWSPCDYRVRTSAECPASQKELVKAAFRNCPNDPEIALWYESLFSENLPLPDTITFSQYAQAPAAILDGISQIDGSRKYTKDDIALLEKVYSTKAGEFHIRGPARVDDTTRKKIIEILGGRFLYRQKFCKELEKLRLREKKSDEAIR
jgi:hypothetical protein